MKNDQTPVPGELRAAMDRVERMEALFDLLTEALGEEASGPISEEKFKEAAKTLSDYLDSGDWRRDYELDEAGLFPASLKRGVLSQDGLYDLLSELDPPEECFSGPDGPETFSD